MKKDKFVLGGKEITIETGRLAKQATSAILISQGETTVLISFVRADEDLGADFLPLSVEYRELTFAAGKIPGGYFKREGRPTEHEILSARVIDRSLRPLFPKSWRKEIQIIASVLSFDKENDPVSLALTGASLAACLSDVPFDGPVVGVHLGRLDGKLIVNATKSDLDKSDLDMIVAVGKDAIVMVEGGANFAKEADIVDALLLAHKETQTGIELIEKWRSEIGMPKQEHKPFELEQSVKDQLREKYIADVEKIVRTKDKIARYKLMHSIQERVKTDFNTEEYAEILPHMTEYIETLKGELMRKMIVEKGMRIDGRKTDEVRPITIEVGVLPRTHGSALFTRGETQAIVTTTLGTREDEQRIDSLEGDLFKRFILHYNFPPYSVGETGALKGTSRREIGHGALAERALKPVLPAQEKFDYTIRIVSTILESNGSSSMATVCGGSLALMDAGVPISSAIAGVAMGLIKDGDKTVILTDILGDEDHLGDMDFKVAGNREGITAVQMDIKIKGINREILTKALEQARQGRMHVLGIMDSALPQPRPDISPYAPRVTMIQINTDRIRDVIGPGGKMIREITAKTGTTIFVEDDGRIFIASADMNAVQKAIDIIKGLTAEAELNQIYTGKVVRLADFGAFVEILPGVDGLLHISEVANHRIARMEDVMKEGDEVIVKVIGIDEKNGKIRLSRKAALAERGTKTGNQQKEPEK